MTSSGKIGPVRLQVSPHVIVIPLLHLELSKSDGWAKGLAQPSLLQIALK